MKFKFVNKAKDLNPADIQAKMNFSKVAQSAKALSSVKLTTGILKLGSGTITTVVASSAVVLTTVIGFSYPKLFKSKSVEKAPPVEQIAEPLEETVSDPVSAQEEIADLPKSEPEEKETIEVIKEGAPEEILNNNVEIHNSVAENIFIRPKPLPDVSAFYAFIGKELRYPIEHLKNPITGNVEVRFTVNKEGKAVDFKIKKSLGIAFNNEAIRVLRSYENWQPASLNGEAVDYNMDISIRFQTK